MTSDPDRIPVFDARQALPAEALEGLRRAHRLAARQKTAETVALGYWTRHTTPDGDMEERLSVALLTDRTPPRVPSSPLPEPVPPPWTLDLPDVGKHAGWRRLLELLRPGDQLGAALLPSSVLLFLRAGNLHATLALQAPEEKARRQPFHRLTS